MAIWFTTLTQLYFRRCGPDLRSSLTGCSKQLLKKRQRITCEEKKNTFPFDKIVAFLLKQILHQSIKMGLNMKLIVELGLVNIGWSYISISWMCMQANDLRLLGVFLPSFLGWGLIMDGAPDNNSSLLPILTANLSTSFVERPIGSLSSFIGPKNCFLKTGLTPPRSWEWALMVLLLLSSSPVTRKQTSGGSSESGERKVFQSVSTIAILVLPLNSLLLTALLGVCKYRESWSHDCSLLCLEISLKYHFAIKLN